MSDDDLLFTTATRAAGLIRGGLLSPVELMESVLRAAREARSTLNPFATIMEEEAMSAAKASELAVTSGAALGPLHGVPVSVKDRIDVAGSPTKHGSAIYANNFAQKDDVTVARLRAAGAIIFAKTTQPEFAHKGLTDGPSFGITRNPWDTSRTPGGSSGGAAAAVAAGIGPLALGTDGAGSIRAPAACCGIVGLKPTLGSIPSGTAADAFGNYSYQGPMARSVTDAAVMRAIMTGPDDADPWTLCRTPELPLSAGLIGRDLGGLRLGIIMKTCNPRVQLEVEANTIASISALTDLGAQAEEAGADVDWAELPGRILYQGNYAVAMQGHLARWSDQMDPSLLAFVERGEKFTLHEFRQSEFARSRLFRRVQELFKNFDVLVTPTLSRTALQVTFDAAHDQVEIEGQLCGSTRQGWTSYLYPFNLTGHPALTVPSGFDAAGLPTAVQLIGRWGADIDLLRLGAILEEARPWAVLRPEFR